MLTIRSSVVDLSALPTWARSVATWHVRERTDPGWALRQHCGASPPPPSTDVLLAQQTLLIVMRAEHPLTPPHPDAEPGTAPTAE